MVDVAGDFWQAPGPTPRSSRRSLRSLGPGRKKPRHVIQRTVNPRFLSSVVHTMRRRGGSARPCPPGPVRLDMSDRPYRSSFCDSRAKMAAYTMAMDAEVYGRDFKLKHTLKSSCLEI